MKSIPSQFDMFELDPSYRAAKSQTTSSDSVLSISNHSDKNEDDLVRELEDTGRFRILRKLVHRPIINRADSPFNKLAVLIDTETTGLLHTKDEVIEIGAVAFTYSDDGSFGDVVGVFNALCQPSMPIPPEITRLTGITDELVAGHSINIQALEAFIEPADLIIAHNASFDRPFCEKLSSLFIHKSWACSNSEISWTNHGFEGTKLSYLLGQSDLFHDGHRATDDCHALLEILVRQVGETNIIPFAELLKASRKTRIRIYAENSPFDLKDHLKSRGYRWSDGSDGRPKAWWIEIDEADYTEELHYLRTDIYRWKEAAPLSIKLSAQDRFKAK